MVKLSIAESSAVLKFDDGDYWWLVECAVNARATAEKCIAYALKSGSPQAHGMAEHYKQHADAVLDLVKLGFESINKDLSWSMFHHAKTANLIPESISGYKVVRCEGILKFQRSDANSKPIRQKGTKLPNPSTSKAKTSKSNR